jgi:hypothetical protein
MKRIVVLVCCAVAICTNDYSAFAKGRTVKILITGERISSPIESTDVAIRQFGIWEGPGVNGGGLQNSGFIAAWYKGIVSEPQNALKRYTVSFYEGCKFTDSSACHSEEPSLAYVVFYAYDSSNGKGHVYIPGKGEEWYELNVRSIYRKVEGNWFIATDEWSSFMLPLIQQASR